MYKHGVAFAVGIDQVKAGKGMHAHGIAPVLKILRLVHSQPLLYLTHLSHARIANSIGTMVGAQYRAMH